MSLVQRVFLELESEHRLIERMIEVLKKTPKDHMVAERIFHFFKKFADEIHHLKEENVLFQWIEKAGGAQGGPKCSLFMEFQISWNPTTPIFKLAETEGVFRKDVDVSGACAEWIKNKSFLSVPLEEHIAGKIALKTIEKIYFREGTTQKFSEIVSFYSDLLKAHIQKEEECLFVGAAEQLKSFTDESALQADFDRFQKTADPASMDWPLEVSELERICETSR